MRVFELLPYSDRLRLQSVNRFWRDSLQALDRRIKANPSEADCEDMRTLVMQAENYRRHWAPEAVVQSRQATARPSAEERPA